MKTKAWMSLLLLLALLLTVCAAQAEPTLADYSLNDIQGAFEWQGKAYAIVSDWRDDYHGVVDGDGNLVISCEYYGLTYAGEGLMCAVQPAASVSDQRRFYIDLNERWIGNFDLWKEAKRFNDGLAVVSDGLYGYINTAGEYVVECVWDAAADFSGGMGVVCKNNQYGAVDQSGQLVIPCEWDSLSSFKDGLAVARKNGKVGFINTSGQVVIPLEWDSANAFSEGLAAVGQGGMYGFINASGQVVIPLEWKMASDFSEGLARVSDGRAYGYVDQTGQLVIPCEWENTFRFSKGLSSVTPDGKNWGYIDRTGNLVVPCEYKNVSVFPDHGLAVVVLGRTMYTPADMYGVMDATGRLIVPCEYTLYNLEVSDGVAIYRKKSGYGACNANGDETVLAKYDDIAYAAGRYFCLKDYELLIMDEQGNRVF